MRKQLIVYKKHATRTVQEFWNLKHKVYDCKSFLISLSKNPHFTLLIIDHTGRDITNEVLK